MTLSWQLTEKNKSSLEDLGQQIYSITFTNTEKKTENSM
jgi:hypothetical protein